MEQLKMNTMNFRFRSNLPCELVFSLVRAIQQPALEIWQGKESNVLAAQQALYHRAMRNCVVRHGEYNIIIERYLE